MGSSADLLGGAGLRPLWAAAHRRLEDTGGRLAGTAVHLRDLTDDERAAVDRLLGIRSRGRTVRIDLERLDTLLHDRLGVHLASLVAELVGPLRDRPRERTDAAAADQALWDRLRSHPALRCHPALDDWLSRWRGSGAWRRLEAPEAIFSDALAVLECLPETARAGRPNLAARVLGDAHALDDDRPVGHLVLSALAHLDGSDAGRLRAADRRRLWAGQGVIADETSSTVLTAGLRPVVTGPLTDAAAQWAAGGVPLPIPLAAVQAETWRVRAGTVVWVCENPSVLAAAVDTGAALVCVEGRPSVAAQL
ncbi:MAG TPA: TIGR02679 domain-containing protein, partial [Acidimicrobiales bacterium]|nr:TIGR02679 domain-containing protein [Acidimicrobiales bacterium]